MRTRFLLLGTILLGASAIAHAAIPPSWTRYPGFLSPGHAGMVGADINGDGVRELVTTANGSLALLNRKPGGGFEIVSMRAMESGESLSGRIQRLPGTDGGPDSILAAVYTTQATLLITFSGRNFDRVSQVTVVGGFALQSLADIDADGTLEAIGTFGSSSSMGPAVIDVGTGTTEWQDAAYAGMSLSAGQLDADSQLELIASGNSGSGTVPGKILDGVSHAVQWTYPDGFRGNVVVGNFSPASGNEFVLVDSWGYSKLFVSSPQFSPISELNTGEVQAIAVADVSNDGYEDIILGAGQWGEVVIYSPKDWSTVATITNPEHGTSAVVVDDFDGLPGLELAFGSGLTSSGTDLLRMVSLPSGSILFNQTDEIGPHSSVLFADLDGDGNDELVYATHESLSGYSGANLVVLNATTGQELRRRLNVLEPWGANFGLKIRAANIDGDPQLELLLGSGITYSAKVRAIDGLTLADQWIVDLGDGVVSEMIVTDANADAVPDLAVVNGGRVYLLNGIQGSEIWHSVSFNVSGSVTLSAGNLDADANIEIAFGTGTNLYVIDPISQIVDRIQTLPSNVIGQLVESYEGACYHVLISADRLRRNHCASGAEHSSRLFSVVSVMAKPVETSFGKVVLSDGQRIYIDENFDTVAFSSVLGPSLGAGNRAAVNLKGPWIDVYAGGMNGVSKVRFSSELFSAGFEFD